MSMFVFFFRNWDKNLATNCSCQTCWSSLCSDWWSISCCYGTSTSILSEQGWPKRQRASRGPWTSWLLCRKLPTIWWMLEGYKGLMWVLVMHSKPNVVWLNFAEVLDIAKLSAWCLFIVEITSLHQNFICLCYSWKILHDILDNSIFQEMHFFFFLFCKENFQCLAVYIYRKMPLLNPASLGNLCVCYRAKSCLKGSCCAMGSCSAVKALLLTISVEKSWWCSSLNSPSYSLRVDARKISFPTLFINIRVIYRFVYCHYWVTIIGLNNVDCESYCIADSSSFYSHFLSSFTKLLP